MRGRIAGAVGIAPRRILAVTAVAGGSICHSYRADLDDGTRLFAKLAPRAGMIEAEVAGLRWLAEGGARVPRVLGVDADLLVLQWREDGRATADAARNLGRTLATLHAAGAPSFGAAPPNGPPVGWIGSARMPYADCSEWATFYAEHRLRPHLSAAERRGALTERDADSVRELCRALPEVAGPAVPVARIHGDLWSGNVLWGAEASPALIDPAAHGGHPETDLAMLALFGAPYLPDILDGYLGVMPLPPGWQERVALHQLHPVLVHAELFGGGYGAQAGAIARRYLAALPGRD